MLEHVNRPHPTVEVLAASVAAVRTAVAAGADRIELCDNYLEGGTTPSAGTIAMAREIAGPAGTPVMVMIRPRGGGFVYDHDERQTMLRDVGTAIEMGADGIVVGVLTADGEVDQAFLRRLVGSAQGRAVTFHRAVDIARDIDGAAAAAFDCGCARILSSGAAPTAASGTAALARLVRSAPPGMTVMAGGGITAGNVAEIVATTGVTEVHVSARRLRTSGASPSPPGMVGITAGAAPGWPVNGWPAPDPMHLRGIREAAGRG